MTVKSREHIRYMVSGIKPLDQLETDHKQQTLDWIDSSADLYRLQKPAVPNMHLVSYFVMYDYMYDMFMLTEHVRSGLLLPTGGHVEKDESPVDTVVREAREELNIALNPLAGIGATRFGDSPVFVTVTEVEPNHVDVSLWFVIDGSMTHSYAYDRREMNGYHWMSPQTILDADIKTMDPHMHRFIGKVNPVVLPETWAGVNMLPPRPAIHLPHC